MLNCYDVKEWLNAYKGQRFRYWVYKKAHASDDDSPFECEECIYGIIVEAIDLGNDWLLGFSGSGDGSYIEYYRLSEIYIAFSDVDQEEC